MIRKNMMNVINGNVWQERFDIYLVNKTGIVEHMYKTDEGFNTRCDTKYDLDSILKDIPLFKKETEEEVYSSSEGRDITKHYIELYFYVDNKKANNHALRDTSELELRLEDGFILKTFKENGEVVVRLNDDLHLQGTGRTIVEAYNSLEYQYCKMK